ncbi:ABATE domain-containing protein [Kribbella sp. NPDC003505]|uniref:CGNR zinc finger domain-containing protein n=1 Tax=Kribbella sp. NPDC003505 TaxID=3154448 RepID=UPI0033A729F0
MTWLLPDEPVPVRLMATIWADTAGLHDDLAAPSDVDAWLDAVGVDRQGVAATPAEHDSARQLRDSVRRLAALVTADERPRATAQSAATPGQAIAVVNDAASKLPRERLRLSETGLTLAADVAGSPVTTGLAQVAAEAQQLLGENPSLLRACYAPGCVLYFTKTHQRREWCSVACGNRARAARHYQGVRSAKAKQ